MKQHPLRFGVANYEWRFDSEPFTEITEYRIDPSLEHPVMISVKREGDDPWATTRQVGKAKAGGDPGALWVEFETAEPTPRFYSVWRVEKGGVANLSEILLATGPFGGSRA